MAELLDYDDDPADTAAALWLATRLGQRTQELAVTCPESALRRAFRCGFLKANDGAPADRRRALPVPGQARPQRMLVLAVDISGGARGAGGAIRRIGGIETVNTGLEHQRRI